MTRIQSLNKVQLIGRVGAVRTTALADCKIVRISMATSVIEKNAAGAVVETVTWHNVTWFPREGADTDIRKGDVVSLEGRIRNQKYTDAEGRERTLPEILATRLSKIDDSDGYGSQPA